MPETSTIHSLSREPSPDCCILVVQHEGSTEDGIARALRDEGFAVERAPDTGTAADRLEREGIDLVVIEPEAERSGVAWIGRVCSRHPTIPVVALQAPRSPEPPVSAARLLSLPQNADDLHAAVEQARARRRLRQFKTRALVFERAIEQMYLVFQPILRAQTNCIVGYEALLRVSGLREVGALSLLAQADELQRQNEVDDRVRFLLTRSFEDSSHYRTFFLNLSMDELSRGVLGTERDPLAPFASRVILEFGRQTRVPEGRAVRDTLQRIRALGYRIAVGDTAIGNAELLAMGSLKPEIYKLGFAAVHRCDTDPLRRDYIRKVVEHARAEGALVVAQGIERPEERAVVVDLGCDLLQGFLTGMPRASM